MINMTLERIIKHFYTVSAYQIHSQNISQTEAMVDDNCSRYYAVGLNPKPSELVTHTVVSVLIIFEEYS